MDFKVTNELYEMAIYVCGNICKFEPDELDDNELDELIKKECKKCSMWQFKA